MIIAATGDVHSPRYYEQFVVSLDRLNVKPDLFLIAGDMIDRGAFEEYDKIHNAFFGKINCPIVACFGNNEFQEKREEIKKRYSDIKFLDDDSLIMKIGYSYVGVVGTTGSLDTPTPWQKKNLPNIERTYDERVSFVERHLIRMTTNFKILLMHYAPTYKSLEGENPRFYSSMGSNKYERVLMERKPNLVVYGHSHRGAKQVWIDSVPVLNVALPLNREIVIIDTEKLKPGIARFV